MFLSLLLNLHFYHAIGIKTKSNIKKLVLQGMVKSYVPPLPTKSEYINFDGVNDLKLNFTSDVISKLNAQAQVIANNDNIQIFNKKHWSTFMEYITNQPSCFRNSLFDQLYSNQPFLCYLHFVYFQKAS